MDAQEDRLELTGLDNFDALELQSAMKSAGFSIEILRAGAQSSEHRNRYGSDPVISAVLELAPAVLSVVALWMARRQRGETFTSTFSVLRKNGTRESRTIRYTRSSSEAPAAGILREINSSLGLGSGAPDADTTDTSS